MGPDDKVVLTPGPGFSQAKPRFQSEIGRKHVKTSASDPVIVCGALAIAAGRGGLERSPAFVLLGYGSTFQV